MTKKGCGCNEESCLCCMQRHTHWWVDRKGALEASKEIVGTNLHLEGAKLDSFLKEHFDD